MNKTLKNLLFSFSIFISSFFTVTEVSANSINKIEMNVYIDSNGDANVTEVWEVYLDRGTEGYRSYTDLGNSSISNFTVSDDSGKTYEFLSNWNTNADFDNKAYKNGFNYISNGLELCWGISDYGNRTYTLKYDISNLVTQYTDTQGIYFNFLNIDQSVDDAKVTISSDIEFSLDNAKIWGFGNNGTIKFVDGKIVLDSEGYLSSSRYMVSLVRFEKNLFNISNFSEQSFDDVYDSAISDVDENEFDYESGYNSSYEDVDSFSNLLYAALLVSIFNPIVWIAIFLVFWKKKLETNKIANSLDFGLYGKVLPSDDKINYWREIPCNKDLNRAYWVASQYNVVSDFILKEGIIGAILLKWVKDDKVVVSKTRKGLFSFKDNNYAIDFSNMTSGDNEIENDLFNMLKKASGFNNILEAKEFERWCRKNYVKVDQWFSSLDCKVQNELKQQGLITEHQTKIKGMFGQEKTITINKVHSNLKEDAIQLKGLKKFLLEFSMMPEREYFEVHIWEEYLIFAQLLGIADKVEEQFSKLYPKFGDVSKLNLDLTTTAVRNMVELGYKGAQTGREKARRRLSSSRDYSGSSRSSGGGGSSYSSGGSSSRGSSGGGFR